MKTQLPDIDLPIEFVAGMLEDDNILSRYNFPCRIHAALFVLCSSGGIEATVNLADYHIRAGSLITILPGTIIQFKSMEPDTQLHFMGFSADFFKEMSIVNNQIDFFAAAARRPILPLKGETAGIYTDYFKLLRRAWEAGELYHDDMLRGALVITVMSIRNHYMKHVPESDVSTNRGEMLYKKLTALVMENFESEKRVSFYAKKLNVTPQHLSSTVRKVSGRTVSDVIAEIVIADAKAKLRSTSMTIQEISYSLNFPNASFFGKYFKRYTGSSPREYRFSGIQEI